MMTQNCKNFLIGAAVGALVVTFLRTDTFRKGCAKIVSAGLQLKDEASEFFETVKEDAEDATAESKQKKGAKA